MPSRTSPSDPAASRLGFIGTGSLTTHLVIRLSEARSLARPPVLSPRSPTVAAELAERYGADVADSNQAVVDRSDIVFLCLPAAVAARELAALRFGRQQYALSAVAGLPHGRVSALVAPATAVSIMLAGAPSRLGVGLTVAYPEATALAPLLGLFGPVQFSRTEGEFQASAVFGGLSGCLFHLARDLDAGLRHLDVEPAAARRLVAEAFRGVGHAFACDSAMPIDDLVASVATEGGMTVQGLGHLLARDNSEAWRGALTRMAAFRHDERTEPAS